MHHAERVATGLLAIVNDLLAVDLHQRIQFGRDTRLGIAYLGQDIARAIPIDRHCAHGVIQALGLGVDAVEAGFKPRQFGRSLVHIAQGA